MNYRVSEKDQKHWTYEPHVAERVALALLKEAGVRSYTGQLLNEGTIYPVHAQGTKHGPAYQVPYRAITPKPDECTNLLVPVALSATHVAYSSLRVEPCWMVIGHSTGIAAALAAKGGEDVQRLDHSRLKQRLLAQKQIIDRP